jgi:hypothetical protein
MPLHPDFQKVMDRMMKQYGPDKGKQMFYAWKNKHGYDDTKAFPGKKESAEIRINEKLKFTVPFIVESLEVKEGEAIPIQEANCRKIRGTMLKATTSRNGRTYTMENIEKAKFTSDTLSLNHTEDVTDNVGTFTPHITRDGIDFEAKIYNTGKHPYVTDMIDKGLIKFTSIEAIAGELVSEGDQMVAKDLDITGLGLVKTPGIPEATFAIAEAFEGQENPVDNIEGDKMEETKIEQTPAPAPVESHIDSLKMLIEEVKTSNANLAKKYEEEAALLKREITSLKESKSKGIVTDERKPSIRLKMETMKDGLKEFYSPDFLY